tara:strand:+ start:4440 stop:5372 length:933 start_codon:yes stop_codon:yes gene_type:complete
MNELNSSNQTKLVGLDKYILELISLFNKNRLPSKILLSGPKGIGKSTLAYHFINYILSLDEEFKYDLEKFQINENCRTFKTIQNKSNLNFTLIDIDDDKKFIDINQIRDLILNLSKSSFNNKPRFVLIDNIEFLNTNSVNALLKILEEPTKNVYFILINNNKRILSTLTSRCINFKISLTHNNCLEISNKLLNDQLNNLINKDLINFYLTPGNIFKLIKFGEINNYDLMKINLNQLLIKIIEEHQYKKYKGLKFLFFDLIEYYFRSLNDTFSSRVHEKYSYFLKRISDTKRFNLDEESLFIEFKEKVLNG